MARQVSAPDAQRRSDDAVRRIRGESARRIEGRRRQSSFFSSCALATLAIGISLASLDAREPRVAPPVAAVAPRPPEVQAEIGPVTVTPPRPAPAIGAPKKNRCFLWEDDLFQPIVRHCVAWTAHEREMYLHGPACGTSSGKSLHGRR